MRHKRDPDRQRQEGVDEDNDDNATADEAGRLDEKSSGTPYECKELEVKKKKKKSSSVVAVVDGHYYCPPIFSGREKVPPGGPLRQRSAL